VTANGVDSKILMDAGPPPDMAVRNSGKLGIDLRTDAIFISHGHYDHLGGLQEVLQYACKPTTVVVHPNAFLPKFSVKPKLKFIGPNFNQSSIANAGETLLLVRNPVELCGGVTTTGEIARQTSFEKPEGFRTVQNERFKEDQIIDDQALVVNVEGKGLVVITGCAYSGIINTVRHVQKISGQEDVHAVIGGFHLEKADKDSAIDSGRIC
jgi:7,8-dihydropterin-6-yl-methyl-4-(beta-D-ribofuranosyl)aminobenzene 5'-phosphate synthase